MLIFLDIFAIICLGFMPKVLLHIDVNGGRFARGVHSSDYIDHLSFEKSWKGELAYADHY